MLAHLAPEAELALLLRSHRSIGTQTAVSLASVWLPLYADAVALACLKVDGKLAGIRVPRCAPDLLRIATRIEKVFSIYRLSIDKDFLIAAIVVCEAIFACSSRFNLTLVGHESIGERKLWEVFDHLDVLEIDRVLATFKGLHARSCICSGQCTFLALLVIELEDGTELRIVGRITETAHRVCVKEHTIVLVRHHEWDRHLGVILEELLVLALVVPIVGLMLTQAIESLVGRRLEHGACCPAIEGSRISLFCRTFGIGCPDGLLAAVWSEGLASTLLFLKDHVACCIGKPNLTSRFQDIGLDATCLDSHGIAMFGNFVGSLLVLWHDDQRLRISKLTLGSSTYSDDLLSDNLKTHELGIALSNLDCHLLTGNINALITRTCRHQDSCYCR